MLDLADVEKTVEEVSKLGERGAALLNEAEKERALLLGYMPKQRSEDDMRQVIARIIAATGAVGVRVRLRVCVVPCVC